MLDDFVETQYGNLVEPRLEFELESGAESGHFEGAFSNPGLLLQILS